MQLDYKGRPFPTWLKVEMSVFQLIALGDAEESVKGVKAAYDDFISGEHTEVNGIAGIIYTSIARTLEESAALTEKQRQGGRDKKKKEEETKKSLERDLEESLTQKQNRTNNINKDREITTTEEPPSFDNLKRLYDEEHINYPQGYDSLRLVYEDLKAKGWRVNDEPVANMGAYLRSYEKHPERLDALRRKGATSPKKKSSFQYVDQRQYDYDAIEKKLLKKDRPNDTL